jgi:hemolysin activation/secretion protein
LSRLQQALAELQAAYREKGYSAALVSSPQQVVTDGNVVIQVSEGERVQIVNFAPPPVTNTPAAPARSFEIRHYQVAGNTLLPTVTVSNILSGATGRAVTLSQVQKAMGDLQLAYRERGYATVSVALPQQQITNATIKVQVTEGRVAEVRVTGNRYFSSNNIVRALPGIGTNETLNSRVLQRELDIANQNRDRQIYPTIEPGAEPGESVLALRVKDRLPVERKVWHNQLLHDFEGASAALANAKPQLNTTLRTNELTPGTVRADGADKHKWKQLHALVNEKMHREGLTYHQAWVTLREDQPELFPQ